MDISNVLQKVEKENEYMDGGRTTSNEVVRFWLLTQYFHNKGIRFKSYLYSAQPGRTGKLDSPYTLVTYDPSNIHVYSVVRVDFKKVDIPVRERAGIFIEFPLEDFSAYEKVFEAFNQLADSCEVQFMNGAENRILEAWFYFLED